MNGTGQDSEVIPKGSPEAREWWKRGKKSVLDVLFDIRLFNVGLQV